jgi:hypothetical protein
MSCTAIFSTFSGPLMFITDSDQGSLVDQVSLMLENITEIYFLSLLRLPI